MGQLAPYLRHLVEVERPKFININLEVLPDHLKDVGVSLVREGLSNNIFHEIKIGAVHAISVDNVPFHKITRLADIPYVEMVHYDQDMLFFGPFGIFNVAGMMHNTS